MHQVAYPKSNQTAVVGGVFVAAMAIGLILGFISHSLLLGIGASCYVLLLVSIVANPGFRFNGRAFEFDDNRITMSRDGQTEWSVQFSQVVRVRRSRHLLTLFDDTGHANSILVGENNARVTQAILDRLSPRLFEQDPKSLRHPNLVVGILLSIVGMSVALCSSLEWSNYRQLIRAFTTSLDPADGAAVSALPVCVTVAGFFLGFIFFTFGAFGAAGAVMPAEARLNQPILSQSRTLAKRLALGELAKNYKETMPFRSAPFADLLVEGRKTACFILAAYSVGLVAAFGFLVGSE